MRIFRFLIVVSILSLLFSVAPALAQKEKESDGPYWVVKNGKVGYVDKKGKIVIDPMFDQGQDFFDGLAPVRIGDKWGYIDEDGKLAIDMKFDFAGTFSEGLAMVRNNRKVSFIDSKGQV